MTESVKTWYGPHACAVCGETIIKAAAEEGGAELDVPESLMRVYRRGSESGHVDLVYPMTWTPHIHGTRGPGPTPPQSQSPV